jgi:hypothetical protein
MRRCPRHMPLWLLPTPHSIVIPLHARGFGSDQVGLTFIYSSKTPGLSWILHESNLNQDSQNGRSTEKSRVYPSAPSRNAQPSPSGPSGSSRLLLVEPGGTVTVAFYYLHPLTAEIVVVSTYQCFTDIVR